MSAANPREEALFDAARQLGHREERAAFLDRECADDPMLRERLAGLLEAAEQAEAFFTETRSALKIADRSRTGDGTVSPSSRDDANAVPGAIGEETIGSCIGRYQLVRKIGEGGCGIVYMAEQREPVRRRVALKIIKLGMQTRSVIERFEAERQALAMMDHPNIARVFDAGATDRGLPYFVMELVRGVKITEYCDSNRLDLRQRLNLFVQICHAIQHAHQKGVVHRDIKPSNIIVTSQDGESVPKVIDFGIAKATEAQLSDKILFTVFAQLIGTPAYMSPEQSEMGRVDIDTRSDIYSLGVLLYELLTGRTPFDARTLQEAGLDEMRRMLRECEPLRPSSRLSALPAAELKETASRRATEPGRLVAQLRGDLDWVVMKALEKDRRRRYETANGLAMDIQRYLLHEPVIARPPSWFYRFQKLVRRNRVVFAAGAAVVAALVAGTSTSTWLFLREREARRRAVAAEQQQSRLRHEAELRERLTQAALLVSQEKFAEADQLLSGFTPDEPTLEGAAVLRALGEWHALHGRWVPAANRFNQLLRVNQLDGSDVATLDLLECGPALVELGDASKYNAFRREMVLRFAEAPYPFPDRILKISLLLPPEERLIERLTPFAEATATSLTEVEAAGDLFRAAWRSLAVALWEYRRGRHFAAVEWCERCLAYPEKNAPRAATAHAILAMAQQRLGNKDRAHEEFARGRELLENRNRTQPDRGTPVHGFWFDWEFARILLRECEYLLTAPGGAW